MPAPRGPPVTTASGLIALQVLELRHLGEEEDDLRPQRALALLFELGQPLGDVEDQLARRGPRGGVELRPGGVLRALELLQEDGALVDGGCTRAGRVGCRA